MAACLRFWIVTRHLLRFNPTGECTSKRVAGLFFLLGLCLPSPEESYHFFSRLVPSSSTSFVDNLSISPMAPAVRAQ